MDKRHPGEQGLKSAAFEAAEDVGVNPSGNGTFGDVVAARFGRRDLMRGLLGTAAVGAVFGADLPAGADRPALAAAHGGNTFKEVARGVDADHHVAEGYSAEVVIRWGDPITADAPALDPMNQTPEDQRRQFGYNNDFLGYFPLPRGSNSSTNGLLGVNHEYTDEELMFPGVPVERREAELAAMTDKRRIDIEIAAHGGSVVEVRRGPDGKWTYVKDSTYNRRITGETEFEITGPAAGHDRMKTSDDPTGRRVRGMLNNCAGGTTPWGTWLSAEENVNGYFTGNIAEDHPEARNHKRMGVPGNGYNWGTFHDRFDISKEPNEPNRFGWIAEIDPYDPNSVPKKRTALGRFKHECCTIVVNGDGRVAAYSGDDERFDYVYKFVTAGRFHPNDRAANRNLLDEGTLHVARFNADGSVDWLPLVYGQGPLTEANGFRSQADVLIETRRAGDLLGATRMDRPEDVEAHPTNGRVYVMLTNNARRTAEQVDAANPRANNTFGHIVEMVAPNGDHTAPRFAWNILVRCGDPGIAEVGATFNPATSQDGWFGMPDNCAFDHQGRLWVTTDGNSFKDTRTSDGVYTMETDGELRGASRLFYRTPVGSEMCGPCFTPDDETLFVAVQHPGTDNVKTWPGHGRESTFADPATRWPDFQPDMPPRPSIVAITRNGGGRIGT
ncbi:MAG TPA: PhoX family phosphatase [Azospirillaceae bacterium]|nr:PhoX family phosphatase [Azospirillaceae bacterium]